MRTLSEAVQVAIINEAGSTYRNLMLGVARESSIDPLNDNAQAVIEVTQAFIDLVVKNLK